MTCYSRAPQDLSSQPPVESLKALYEQFRSATADKGLPTKIYEDAEPADKELLEALNNELQAQGASFEIPDGYKCETLKEP